MATTQRPRRRRTEPADAPELVQSEPVAALASLENADPTGDAAHLVPPVIEATEPEDPRWRDLPWRQRFNVRRITGSAPVFPLLILFALNAVDELDRTAFATLTPEIKDAFGLSFSGVLTLTAVILPVGLLLELPIGYFADRKNRVRMATGGAFLWGIFSAMTGFAGISASLLMLYVARAGSAIAKNFNATHNSLLADWYPVEQRARVFYFHRFANNVGQFLGPALAGVLAAVFTWETPFFVFVVPTMVTVFLALRLREPKRGVYERLAAGADQATAETEEAPAGFGETFRVLFTSRSARRIYFSLPFLTASTIGIASILSLFYDEVYNVGPLGRGILGSGGEVAQVLGLAFGAVFVQRLMTQDPGRVMRLLGVVAIVQATCMGLIAASVNVWMAIAAQIANGAVSAVLLPGILAVISLAVPPRMRTLGFATGNLWILMGVPVIPIVGGVADAYGPRVGLALFIPVFLVGSMLLASAGSFIGSDIQRLQTSAKTQAELRRRREEGDPQMLVIRGLDAGYDQTQILFGVDLEVSDGEIIALLGTNGAGKSTLLKAISGLIQPWSGAIIFDGQDITNADAIQSAHLGIAQVPGGRGIFPSLTVGENLRAAGWMYRKDKKYVDEQVARVTEMFPILRKRWDTPAGNLSGGEQQMLSLAQAFIAKPKLLMIDELSLGLAPTIVEQLLDIVRAIHDQGTTIILVEQSVNVALRIAKRAVFMEKGEVRFFGPTDELLERPDVLRSVFLEGAQSGMQIADGNGAGNGNGASGATVRRTAAERRADRARRDALLAAPVVLEVSGITKRYGGVTAVNDVSFQLHDGQVLGLIGPNGAGKTTIFDLVSGFSPLDAGRVQLLGRDITSWPPHRRAALGLSRSFQDARLWPSLTVREALAAALAQKVEVTSPLAAAFGLPSVQDSEDAVDEEVERLIALLGLGAFRDKFVSELSTGSRRMVEIATLIANEPKVLILDEPSSGIAQKETEALGPVLKEVQRFTGCSILVIEHDMPLLASIADHVVALELGAVIAFGTPDEVLNHPRVIESYLGTATYDDIGIGTGEPKGSNGRARRTRRTNGTATRTPTSKNGRAGTNGATTRRRTSG